MKNEHAAALGRLKRGKQEKFSLLKKESSRVNVAKAREAMQRIKEQRAAKNDNPPAITQGS